MVARTPTKQRRMMFPSLNPTLLKETVIKVDKCMARLQELQNTVSGSSKLAPSRRIKNTNSQKSPPTKLPAPTGEWRRMSLPAMLVGETVKEILQATQFTREIIVVTTPPCSKKNRKPNDDDPKTPVAAEREGSELRVRRRREKHVKTVRKESASPVLTRARSRITFKASSPLQHLQHKDNNTTRYMCANRVSPRGYKPWTKKAVLFPNPLFQNISPTSNTNNQRFFCKTKSPILTRNRPKTPHKFLIKTRSPPSSKFQVKISGSPKPVSLSGFSSLKAASSTTTTTNGAAARLRRSFSPSRLANRLISPLKNTRKATTHERI